MIENNPTGVVAAFEILLEEIEAEIEFVNRLGASAFGARDYDNARKALDWASQVTSFRDKVIFLRREWESLFVREEVENTEGTRTHVERNHLGRLRRGLRTREESYYRPILEALQALGGSAPMNQVLDRVLQNMKGTLKDVDYEPLPSDPDTPRWRNAAQWARNAMVKEGLLRNDSPRGLWQISEAGIRFLRGERR